MEVEVEVRGFGEYVVINPTIVVAYRMLIYNARMTVARLRTMAGQGHTVKAQVRDLPKMGISQCPTSS